jgi:RNA polymerase sigma-70 factor (ECF subfamily)
VIPHLVSALRPGVDGVPLRLPWRQHPEPGPASLDDASLVARARHDYAAFAPIYDRHFAGVYGYCYRLLGSQEAAEDAAQQVFAQALAALPRYQETGRFRSWLYAIAHHIVSEQRAVRRHNPLDEEPGLHDPGRTPEEEVLHALERGDLHEAISRLPADQRRVIELRLAGLKGREIAAELGRSHEAIRMLQLRALDRLATELGGSPARTRRGTGARHGA